MHRSEAPSHGRGRQSPGKSGNSLYPPELKRPAGPSRPGDEKAFALTRQSRCIPIVATQAIVSLKSVLSEGEAWRAVRSEPRDTGLGEKRT